MSSKIKIDKIPVELASEEEAFWINKKLICENSIKVLKNELKMNEHIFEMCIKNIKHEKLKTSRNG